MKNDSWFQFVYFVNVVIDENRMHYIDKLVLSMCWLLLNPFQHWNLINDASDIELQQLYKYRQLWSSNGTWEFM